MHSRLTIADQLIHLSIGGGLLGISVTGIVSSVAVGLPPSVEAAVTIETRH